MRAKLGIIALLLALCSTANAQGVPGFRSKPHKPTLTSQNRWAVVVGVSEYQHLPKKSWLNSCHKDASVYAEFLSSPRGGEIPASQLKLLLNQDATARNIRIALDHVITNSRPGDAVYFFYAGHGKVRSYGSGEAAYLMAYDSEPEYLNATAIPMEEIHRYVDVHLRRASQVIMVTDACHAGAIVPTTEAPAYRPRAITEYLQGVGEREGVLNLMACRRNEVAFEDSRLGGHGVLTYNLLRVLQGEGQTSRDRKVRVQDVLEFVSRQVPRLTNQRQHPRYNSNYTDEFALSDLSLPGPNLHLPEPPGSPLESAGKTFGPTTRGVTLKVVGAERMAELYVVKGGEQRTIGRALSPTNILIKENLEPGTYQLFQLTEDGDEKSWEIELTESGAVFDLQQGRFR